MCGIYGYIGSSKTGSKIVANGLKRLEYRGYDSWGISYANMKQSQLKLIKKVGGISEYNFEFKEASNLALGHTRWATHGGVTEKNAHPHLNDSKTLGIVHNGIVENLTELEILLNKDDYHSDTDTERILEWIVLNPKNDPLTFLVENIEFIKGMNTFVLIDKFKDRLIGVHLGSPLVIGKSKTGFHLSSDPLSFDNNVSKISFLKKGQVFEINKTKVQIFENSKTGKKLEFIKADKINQKLSLDGYAHYTLKEIHDQPKILFQFAKKKLITLKKFQQNFSRFRHLNLIGCGSAYHAALFGQYLFTNFGSSVQAIVGSEYEYFCTPSYKDLAIYISQSGETADLISTLEKRNQKKLKSLGIINRPNSTLERLVDQTLPLEAGVEYSVVSTKAFMAQIGLLLLLSDLTNIQQNQKVLGVSAKKLKEILKPDYFKTYLIDLLKLLKTKDQIFILGKGKNYPLALEMALKLKEAALINAQAFAAGELKHGVLALIESGVVCICLMSQKDNDFKENLTAAIEVKARGGFVVGICESNQEVFDYHVKLPHMGKGSVFGITLIGQLLAYYLSVSKQINPDKPRNLAKSVTVK